MARPLTVYVLASRSRALYSGVTRDLETRLAQHRAGESRHTARYGIDRLVYVEEYPEARDAVARERQLKGWTRAKKGALIERENPTWRDLAPSRYGATERLDVARRDPSTSWLRRPSVQDDTGTQV